MLVIPIAHTLIDWDALRPVLAGTKLAEAEFEPTVTDIDHLGEIAGRVCYKALERKRPETATTEGYLDNILGKGHYSVLEHASVTFYVEGVSRSLLTELERHRHLSYSVESQRYVDQAASHPTSTVPPLFDLLDANGPWTNLQRHYTASLSLYEAAVETALEAGYDVKEAREAARAFLPNATPVDLIVSGNVRAWRDVIGKRYHEAADREIREFASLVLDHLRSLAPHSVQDIPEVPYH